MDKGHYFCVPTTIQQVSFGLHIITRKRTAFVTITQSSNSVQELSKANCWICWFVEWKTGIQEKNMSPKEKAACHMSPQCSEDLESCLTGFVELCTKMLDAGKTSNQYVTPSLINSDVIENEINQQRST